MTEFEVKARFFHQLDTITVDSVLLNDDLDLDEKLQRVKAIKKGVRVSVMNNFLDLTERLATIGLLSLIDDDQFPFVRASEWEAKKGVGDLVFSGFPIGIDGKDRASAVLIMEIKAFGESRSGSRYIKKRKVREQVITYMRAWKELHPRDLVFGCIFTDTVPVSFPGGSCDARPYLNGYISEVAELGDDGSVNPLSQFLSGACVEESSSCAKMATSDKFSLKMYPVPEQFS